MSILEVSVNRLNHKEMRIAIARLYSLHYENCERSLYRIDSAQFPLPDWQNIQDYTAGKLLLNAAKLSLRNGANSFRCLGRLSVTPRPYQIVSRISRIIRASL